MSTAIATEVITDIIPRSSSSLPEYPYKVMAYQFKELEEARGFMRDCLKIPKIGCDRKVTMSHRKKLIRKTITDPKGKDDNDPLIIPITLDVTTDSPEEAERKYDKR